MHGLSGMWNNLASGVQESVSFTGVLTLRYRTVPNIKYHKHAVASVGHIFGSVQIDERNSLQPNYVLRVSYGLTSVPRIWQPTQISRRKKCDMKQSPYRVPTNIGRQCTTFCRPEDLMSRICTPLP